MNVKIVNKDIELESSDLGDNLFFDERFAEALPFFDKAIAENPNDMYSFLHRAKCHNELGNHVKALLDCKRAERLGFMEDDDIKMLYGVMESSYLRIGWNWKAEQTTSKLDALYEEPEPRMSHADLQKHLDEWDKAYSSRIVQEDELS